MFGILGILGCIYVCAVASVVIAGVSLTVSVINANKQQEAAEKQAKLTDEARRKAEDSQLHDKIVQKKQIAQNLLKTSQAIGDSIAGAQLQRKHALQDAYKVRCEAASEATKNRKSAI